MKKIICKALDEVDCYSAAVGTRLADKFYRELPKDDIEFLSIVEEFIYESDIRLFSIGTQWLKKRKSLLDIKYISVYEKWIMEGINGWGECDQFCYRLLNPLLAKYPEEVFHYCRKWTDSNDFNQKRIGIVALTGSSLTVAVPFDKVKTICDKMKYDQNVLIQKAVGWVLKYSYIKYPNELIQYLTENVDELTRTTFRYALEKVPKEERAKLMKL